MLLNGGCLSFYPKFGLLADEPRRIVDNLPGATSFVTADKSKKYYAAGFKLGFYENDVSPTPLATSVP